MTLTAMHHFPDTMSKIVTTLLNLIKALYKILLLGLLRCIYCRANVHVWVCGINYGQD